MKKVIKALTVLSLITISNSAWANTGTTLCKVLDDQGQEVAKTYLFHNDTVVYSNGLWDQTFECMDREGIVSTERQCRVDRNPQYPTAFHIVELDTERNLIIRAMGNIALDNHGVWLEDVACEKL